MDEAVYERKGADELESRLLRANCRLQQERARRSQYVDLVLSSKPIPDESDFVDIEIDGHSVACGQQFEDDDGCWRIRITATDIYCANEQARDR